ncbi:MAG: hypothetical protein AAGB12_16030 [Pseudomonadota bacterium]
MQEVLEIMFSLLVAATIHFLVLVYHNNQEFSSRTFLKSSMRIIGTIVCIIVALFITKPLHKNATDGVIFVMVLVCYFLYLKFFTDDYKND